MVPLPAEEVLFFIAPEVQLAERLTNEEVADEEEKQDREKTTILPIANVSSMYIF